MTDYDHIPVRRSDKTKAKIAQLQRLMSAELGVKVKRPDAVHTAIVEAIEKRKRATAERRRVK